MPTSGPRSARTFKALTARRDWAPSEKRRIVAEMIMPGTNISALARRHGVVQSQLYQWRKSFASDAAPREASSTFVPVVVAPSPPDRSGPPTPVFTAVPAPSRIEIVLICGRTVRVDADVDAGKLAALIAALEAKA